jgi:hypothetical protein
MRYFAVFLVCLQADNIHRSSSYVTTASFQILSKWHINYPTVGLYVMWTISSVVQWIISKNESFPRISLHFAIHLHGVHQVQIHIYDLKVLQRLYAPQSLWTRGLMWTQTIAETEGDFGNVGHKQHLHVTHGSMRFSWHWPKSTVFLDVRSCSFVGKHLSTKLHGITSQKTV